jgi:hypothetical protein
VGLHSLQKLGDYMISLEDGHVVSLDYCIFQRPDETQCHITHLAARLSDRPEDNRALIPTGRILSVDDENQSIRINMTKPELIRASVGHRIMPLLKSAPEFSTKDLLGCRVSARDGDSGVVVDFLVDAHRWDLRYFELDTGSKVVLVDPAWVSDIDASHGHIAFDLPLDAISQAPAFKDSTVINSGYCEVLYRHFTSRQYMH